MANGMYDQHHLPHRMGLKFTTGARGRPSDTDTEREFGSLSRTRSERNHTNGLSRAFINGADDSRGTEASVEGSLDPLLQSPITLLNDIFLAETLFLLLSGVPILFYGAILAFRSN
ncbi:hypothetical protein FB446DRAFT_793262 [Lentinula raphanica]|nr:hypothetical protein FB446DRAFT_793262 [Lentinula raphanica]KAJ3816714.1 hypothetical protein F5880DRAFT_1619011 [Lentinula raphanica]